MKIVIAITFTLLVSTLAQASQAEFPDFEAELRALETNQIKKEELQMYNADAVTDVISDEVATGQAGILRENSESTRPSIAEQEKELLQVKNSPLKPRRVRSR